MDEEYKAPTRSTEVKLRKAPGEVESLSSEPEEYYDYEEEAFERSLYKPKTSNTVTIVLIIAGLVLAIAIIIGVFLYLRARQQAAITSGPSIVAVLGESCTEKPCAHPLICEEGICKGTLHGPCFNNQTCVSGYTCQNQQCIGGLFARCTSNFDCGTGLLCVSDTCITNPNP